MGELFNHIQVSRVRDGVVHYTKVPITYSPKEKFLNTMKQLNYPYIEGSSVAKVDTILPRLCLNIVDMQYDPLRKTSPGVNQKMGLSQPKGKTITQFNPVPYKIIFELGIYTRFMDDAFQIVEQILPYFQPHFNCKITELHKNDIKIDRDVKIGLQSTTPDVSFEGDFNDRRHVEWSMMFELNGWIYPPVTEAAGEIRTVYTNFFASEQEIGEDDFTSVESVDSQLTDLDMNIQDYTGSENYTTYADGLPIPTGDEPPKPRQN